jgi:hypothetical protein
MRSTNASTDVLAMRAPRPTCTTLHDAEPLCGRGREQRQPPGADEARWEREHRGPYAYMSPDPGRPSETPRQRCGRRWKTRSMKHAGDSALDRLEPLLLSLRDMPALREKSRGTFYRGGRAFVHFHEDGTGLFADVRFVDEFERIDVTTVAKQQRLTRSIRAALERGDAR